MTFGSALDRALDPHRWASGQGNTLLGPSKGGYADFVPDAAILSHMMISQDLGYPLKTLFFGIFGR